MLREDDFSRLELDLKGCQRNYRYFRSLLEPQTKLLVLVKANAYGHGAVEFAAMMQRAGADYLAVAYPVEGLELRENGISLPIKRVIFAETEKYDGREFRSVTTAEVNQIGGRAGRYGLNEFGEVLVLGNKTVIQEKLGKRVPNVRAACIAFPREVLETEYPLDLLLRVWQQMERNKEFLREDMQEARILLKCLKGSHPSENQRELIFDLITCPVDTRTEELVNYWAECAKAILRKKRVPLPWFGTESLLDCELQYKAYDIHHQLSYLSHSDASRIAILELYHHLLEFLH